MSENRPARAGISTRTAALSVLLFWTGYYVVTSARSAVSLGDRVWGTFDNRALVTLCGMTFTWLLYLFLRAFDRRPLGQRVAAAFLASVPVALAYATVNYVAFRDYNVRGGEPNPPPYRYKSPAVHVFSAALEWYFFIAAWAALYLTLSYAAAVRESEREAARLRAATQEAELRALRYQVNPHFLFNALNSVSSLVMAGRNAQAETMLLNLSRFFRTGLATDPTEDVPLADEIALQRLYLEVEAVRFPERLRTEIELEPGVEDVCVPGMILQPLIENAIKYGVSPSRRLVTVRVTARRADDRLRLEVSDDGEAGAPCAGGTGTGLRNVRERLMLRFGSAATLTSGRRAGGGFVVTIEAPIVRRGC
jgi:two-component system, LytTR family, sensor kinase